MDKRKDSHNGEANDFVSVTEAARLFKVTRKTVLNWIYKGTLKAFQTGGGRYRIFKSEIDRLNQETGFVKKAQRIMLIDDEKLMLRTLKRFINKLYPKIEVTTHESAIKAILDIGKADPDLLILDIKMPDMDGFKVVDEIKRSKRNVKILIVSAFLDEENISRLKEIHIDDYMKKPIDIWDLKAKLDEMLEIN